MNKTFKRLLAMLLIMSITFAFGITASASYYDYEIDEELEEELDDEFPLTEGYYLIKASYCDKYFDVVDATSKSGAHLRIWKRSSTSRHNQVFYISPVGDYWKISVASTNKVLSAKKYSNSTDTFVAQADYKNKKSQLWKITENNNGTFSIINKYSGQAMDIPYADNTNGTGIIQFPYGSFRENQQFEFIPVSNNGTPISDSSNKPRFETEYTYRVIYNYSGYSFENSTIPKPDIPYLVKEEKIEANAVLDMICSQVYPVSSEDWNSLVKLAREGKKDGSVNALSKKTYVTFSLRYDYDAVYIYSSESYAYSIWK